MPTFQRPTRLQALAPSQIRDMMRLAMDVGAVNMAQGAPDFPAAPEVKLAAIRAIAEDKNQYSVTWGLAELREAVAARVARRFGLHADPEREVTITCGVTEAVVAALLATLETGDEVIIIEPAHENYLPATAFAGGVPRFVPLRPPKFALDVDALAAAVTPRTRVLILNTPHNPSGRVFTRAELLAVADLAERYNLLVLTDEIYDEILYDGREHIAFATLPGMAERTITTGGISKIYAVTGWRLGYVIAPPPLSAAIRTVHDYLTICAPTPFQHAALTALALPDAYYEQVRAAFHHRRARMMRILEQARFNATPPEGAYYVLADFSAWQFDGDDEAFARFLITDVGVAVVPGSAFYTGHPELGRRLVRFAFAKRDETFDEVERRFAAYWEQR
ncbi:aminotransferase [Ardenticatena maritima]|uniref:Aminotransferase n=1 Tax=Ardenticatena maritima TaxID=872965 RepID=A0A0M9UDN9_9CHLR|nr:aminotransferase class I/II-fold pyridoxal phosphate-dependent enzyme [Ardenticatena maritima]KPL89165.1 aminotransferase [Ardenticatena maritima]GAP64157.1 aminotransferase [Ardenticatena maritima]